MSWTVILIRSVAAGLAGVIGAAVLDALDVFVLARLPFNFLIEVPKWTVYFVLWPASGILDGVDGAGYNRAAHMASWAWNGSIYAAIALAMLTIKKLDRATIE